MTKVEDVRLSDLQKRLLHFVMAKGAVRVNECIIYIQTLISEFNDNILETWIADMNALLGLFSFRLGRRYFDEEDADYIVFWNTLDDSMYRDCFSFSGSEKLAMTRIFRIFQDSESLGVSSIELIQETWNKLHAKSSAQMSKTQIQNLIEKLLSDGWLFKRENGELTFGIRAKTDINESASNLQADLFKICLLCKQIITVSNVLFCKNQNCRSFFHKKCFQKYSSFSRKGDIGSSISACLKCDASLHE